MNFLVSFRLGSSAINNPLATQLILMISVLAWVDSRKDFIIPNPLVMVVLMFSLSLIINMSSASKVEESVLLCEEGAVGRRNVVVLLSRIPPKVAPPLTCYVMVVFPTISSHAV